MSALMDAYKKLQSGTLWSSTGKCKGFAPSNPGEAQLIDAYVAALDAGHSPPPPNLVTLTGEGIVGMLAALVPPQPPSPMSLFKGLCMYQPGDVQKAVSLTGCTQIRLDWYNAVNPTFVSNAKALNVDILPVACYAMNLSSRGDHYPPDDINAWTSKVVQGITQFGFKQVAVWNEAWHPQFWMPTPDPVSYMNLVKALTAAVWAAAPNTRVLVNADTVTQEQPPRMWRQLVLAADTTGLLADPRIVPETHNYCQGRTPTTVTSQPCWWDFDRYRCAYNDFKAHGNPNKVWVTEMGWISNAPAVDGVTEQQQADYMVQALKMAQASGIVERAYCFKFQVGDTWEYNWLHPDGSAKPVCAAVKAL